MKNYYYYVFYHYKKVDSERGVGNCICTTLGLIDSEKKFDLLQRYIRTDQPSFEEVVIANFILLGVTDLPDDLSKEEEGDVCPTLSE